MKKTATTKAGIIGNGNGHAVTHERIDVLKTYKIYIGGKFPRTESGRYYQPLSAAGVPLGNICLSSRKDARNAVVAARSAFQGWADMAAFNRSQILYRIGEMLEGRKAQFIEELKQQGATPAAAKREVEVAVDRLIYYAGWCDKHLQIFSTVNPVASSHFNFSVPEPMGVVAIFPPQETSLLGLVSAIAPAIAGGNTCVVVLSEQLPLCGVTFAEVLQASDVPGGVVNILSGNQKEILPHLLTHMDVNAIVYCGSNVETIQLIRQKSSVNMKRPIIYNDIKWFNDAGQSPYYINNLEEIKTTWHPIENIGGAGSGY